MGRFILIGALLFSSAAFAGQCTAPTDCTPAFGSECSCIGPNCSFTQLYCACDKGDSGCNTCQINSDGTEQCRTDNQINH